MDMVEIVTTQIIQAEIPTEIHMRIMVILAAHPLHEGRRHFMEEAVATMITAAHVMATVEVETLIKQQKQERGAPTFYGKG
ncbi:RNA-binding motif, X chromosome isoform X1, partial [Sigmodon hispidus]